MKKITEKKQKSRLIFFGKLWMILILILNILTNGFSQSNNLYIRSTGDTGPTSGTNWSIWDGVLAVSGGDANVNASVITNYLQNTGSLVITSPGSIYIYQDIIPSLFGYQIRTLTIAATVSVAVGYTDNGRTIRSAAGGNSLNLILWSDRDGNQDGRIILFEGSQLITNNGHIWMGGGLGHSYWNGLPVGPSYAAAAGSAFYGINIQGATINAGTGNVWMNGKSFNTTGTNRYGVRISNYNGSILSSITCANLDITGVGSAGTGSYGDHDGVSINSGSIITVSGHLNITGTGGGGNSTGGYSYGITINNSTVTVTGNELLYFRGIGGGGSAGNNYGVAIKGGSVVTVNSGDIDIVGLTGTATTLGFVMADASALKCGSSGTGSGRIRIVADDIDFGDALSYISGSGLLSLETSTNFATIRVGPGTGGTLKLASVYFTNNFSSNFSNIYIGGDYSGNITISDAPFRSPVTFKGAAGTFLQPSVNVNITGKTLTLGDNVTLDETNGSLYGTSGTITATRELSYPSGLNVAGLGFVITSSTTLGTTIITRGHTAQSGLVNGAAGIARYYDINPYVNNQSSTIVFNYSGQDVNSLNENAFGLFYKTFAGTTYTKYNGTPDATNNKVTRTGGSLPAGGRWTVGESCLNPSTAGTISSGHTICYNTSASTITGTDPTGYFGDLEYIWQKSTISNVVGFTMISGATATSYSPGTLTETTWFRRLTKTTCTDIWPDAGISNVVTVTVRPQFTPGAIAGTGETICYNDAPVMAIGNAVSGSGGDGTITYSWRSSADSYASEIIGATNSTFTPAGALTATTSYRRYVKDGTCNTTPTVSTGTWTVTVRPQFAAGTIASTGETICYNTSPITVIGNTTSGSGGNGTITYSWRSSTDSYATAISGATNSTFTPAGPLTTTTSYRRYVKDGTCNTTPTASAGIWTVIVRPQFTTGSIDTTGETINYNSSPAQAIGNSISGDGGDGTITYSWRSSEDNFTAAISGATNSTFTPAGPLTVTTGYRRYVKDGTCNTTPTVSPGTWIVTVLSPTVTTTSVGAVTTSSGESGGEDIEDLNQTITAKGIVWNTSSSPTTALSTKTAETIVAGSEDADFSSSLTNLTPNTKYYTRAYIVNSFGTFYGNEYEFFTHANTPASPTVSNPRLTSLDVTINANGNPAITTYAIRAVNSNISKYVHASGILVDTAVWQTETQWEVDGGGQAKRVTNLLVNAKYHFSVKARNGENVATVSGPSDSLYTLAAVPGKPVTSGKTNQSVNISVFDTVNPAITEFAIFEAGSGLYVQSDGTLGVDAVFLTKALWHTAAGNTAVTLTGLLPDSLYSFCVKGRNGDLVPTVNGDTNDVRTLPNVPSPPVVINPAATSLDVSVVINANPIHTRYAIQDSVNSLYVQADGTRGAAPVWRTSAEWDTLTVTGLETGTMYYFRVMAKNLAGDSTVFGLATGRNTCSNPTDGGTISPNQEICYGSTPAALVNVSDASNYGGIREYRWQLSTTSDSTGFSDIEGADTAGFVPGTLTDTTWYRRLSRVTCKPDWINATSSNVVKITVDPTTAGGSVSGDTLVCYGSHASVLTLSDQTGTVLKWQYSTDETEWNDIADSGDPAYTSTNLTEHTWYRAVVQSGVCLVEYSATHKIKVFTNYKISGSAKYLNNPKTPLNGLKIFLLKNSVLVDSTFTGTYGSYLFDSLTNGNFSLVIKSSHPSGNWQTWGGVNMTDYLLAYKHATTGPQLPAFPPVVRISGDVKAPQAPPLINILDASAIQMAAKYGWGNPAYFQIPKWVFSGVTGTIDTISLNCADISFDLRGLCAGDVNGTWLPQNGYKMAEPGLTLVNRGVVALREEMTFPVSVSQTATMGALTLMLNYDPTQIEITGVDMPENAGTPPWFAAENGILSIGWASLEPVIASEGQPVLLIRARLTGTTDLVRFTLNDSPLSELADAEGNVIQNLKLTIPDASSSPNAYCLMPIAYYPVPARDVINVEFSMESDGFARVELTTLQGVTIRSSGNIFAETGMNKVTMNISDLANGIYLTRVTRNGQVQIHKVVVNK